MNSKVLFKYIINNYLYTHNFFIYFIQSNKKKLLGLDAKFVHGAPGGSATVKLAMNSNRQMESRSAFCRDIVLSNMVHVVNSLL